MANLDAITLRILLLLHFTVTLCCAGFCFRPESTLKRSHGKSILKRSHDIYSPHPFTRHLQPRGLSDSDGDDGGGESDEDVRDSYTWEELQADPELRKLEIDSSTNRKNTMLLPQRISKAVTTLGWFFVICGYMLNSIGYAWVRDPSGGIGVGTLDERDFQREVQQEMRRERMKGDEEEKPTVEMLEKGIADQHLFS